MVVVAKYEFSLTVKTVVEAFPSVVKPVIFKVPVVLKFSLPKLIEPLASVIDPSARIKPFEPPMYPVPLTENRVEEALPIVVNPVAVNVPVVEISVPTIVAA